MTFSLIPIVAWSTSQTWLGLASYTWWTIFIGALVGGAGGLIGCFLILRKLALMGDAISHAVLPGIVLAVMISGSLASWPIFIGAVAAGLLTPFLVDLFKRSRRLHEDASLGAVFPLLFAVGVILVTQNAGDVDLDADCVLYGEIATAPFHRWMLQEGDWLYAFFPKTTESKIDLGPRSAWIMGCIFLLNVAFVLLFYKELKICAFDEELATALGMRPKVLHFALLTMVAITTVASFESVGAILVVAMLIAPGACAYLLTDRLWVMLVLSVVLGIFSSIGGYVLALCFGEEVSLAGCMAMAAGLFFALAFLFSPRYGILAQYWRRHQLANRLHRENILATLYRCEEEGSRSVAEETIVHRWTQRDRPSRREIQRLIRHGLLVCEKEKFRLTESGRGKARELLRGHRLWESYLQKLGVSPDCVHQAADEVEHFLSPDLREAVAQELENPARDPHGKAIPPRGGELTVPSASNGTPLEKS